MLKKVALGVVVLALNSQANAAERAGWVDTGKPKTVQKTTANKSAKTQRTAPAKETKAPPKS